MAWILTKNKTNGSGGESQIDTIKVNDVILIPDSDKAVNIEVPTNTNDLVNNSGFITNTVDNLLNYYLKTETYSKNEVNSLIDAVSSVTFEVVQALPSQDISLSTIYLVPKQDVETNDIYDEYIYVNNAWEKIGSTEMDLTGYVTTSDLNNALAAYTTSQNLNNLLNAKQDVLTPGNNINITNGVISATDTTYTSKSAVSGGTDVSLVTTGEKYNWNSKVDSSNLADVALSGSYNDLTNKPNLSDKQDKTDNGIKTAAKTVVGAINELLNKFTNYYTKTEVNEKVDPIKAHTRTNLLNPTAQTQTMNGVTFTNNGDGTYTVNGTANKVCYFQVSPIMSNLDLTKGYKLVGCPLYGSVDGYSLYDDKNNTNVDVGQGKIYYPGNSPMIYIRVQANTTCNNLLFKPMLTTDLSATYNDFVQYSGDGELNENVAEIYKVSDRVSDETRTNLLNPTAQTQTMNGVTFTNNGDGTYTVNGTASANVFYPLADQFTDLDLSREYKIVGCPQGGSWSKSYVYDDINRDADTGNGVIYTPTKQPRLYIRIINGTTCNNLLFKPMITTDLSATYDDFVQYSGDGKLNENVAEIYAETNSAEDSLMNEGYKYPIINGIKNYTDSNGVYRKNLGVVDMGTLNWNYVAQYDYFYVNIPTIKTRTNNIECARYQTYNANLPASSLPNIGIKSSAEDKPIVFIRNTTYKDATAFKNAMSGVLLFYELATPQTWNSKSEISRVSDETRTNLLNPTAQTQTINGVTITNNGDGTYLINGTYTGSNTNWRVLGTLTFEKNMKCKLTGTPPTSTLGQSGSLRLEKVSGGGIVAIDIGNGAEFNAYSETTYVLYLQIGRGAVFDNYLFKPMLTTDLSATYNDYVQYSGDGELNKNVAEIYKVSDRVSNETCTNLLNPTAQTQTINGVTFTNNGDGTYTVNGTATAQAYIIIHNRFDLIPFRGKSLRIVGCPSSGGANAYQFNINIYDTPGNLIGSRIEYGEGISFEVPTNASKAAIVIAVQNGQTVNNLLFKPMITTKLDATYDDYIPYSGSGALNENVARLKSDLSAVENSLTAITLTKSGYTTIASAAMFGTCAFIDFLTSDFNQSTTGWITLFTFSNINITPTATCYSTAIDNFGKTLMLRITTNREVSVYKYETNTPSDIRGQIIFPI